ncbi:MAG TPA: hypothetical protein VNE39_09305 [Planctomycetota bacterium]|nr:hypothetical protein [Planctomycetota bacterium]
MPKWNCEQEETVRRITSVFCIALLTGDCLRAAMGAATPKERSGTDADVPSFLWAAKLFPLPGTKRIYLHQPCDYRIVQARPDLKFQMKPATRGGEVTGFGFVIVKGGQPESFDFTRTQQQFEDHALPLLTQRIAQSGFVFQQTAFTAAGPSGRRLLMIRLRVTPEDSASPRTLTLGWLSVRQPHGRFHSHPNEDYIVFEPWAPAWQAYLDLRCDEGVLHDGNVVFLAIRGGENVSLGPGSGPKGPLALTLSFDRAREAVIEVVVPYEPVFRRQDAKQLLSLSFDEAYSRQARLWKQQLDRAARIEVPEPMVEQIYRTLTLNNLQFLGNTPGVAYLKPGQGGFNNFSVVYGWESSCFLTIMDKQGYGDEVRRVLDYFLTTQQGTHGPDGDISTAEGAFRPHIHWMCETGAILRVFAEHALCRQDAAELRRDSPALLKAARWIQGQRARTKQAGPDGRKVPHYGLMPRGRGTDWPDKGYQFFTDAYTWQGLDRLAAAYESAGLPEAMLLREEADDYRRCILAAVAGAIKPHPLDPSLQWVPDEVYEDPAKALPRTIHAGPQGLLGAGLLAADNPLVPAIEASLRKAGCLNDLFAFRMKMMEDATLKALQERSAGGKVDLYYTTTRERTWHRIWLERGERLKALRYFYMTLAYGTSRDVHLVHERFCPQLPWLLPWQPNASGNGRVLEMILNTLVFEKGDALCLLYGAPDAWFAAKQPLGVTGLHTSFGAFSFRLTPTDGPGSYRFTYECDGRVPSRFLLAIPTGDSTEARRIVEVAGQNKATATHAIP